MYRCITDVVSALVVTLVCAIFCMPVCAVEYSTYLGGDSWDHANDVAIGPNGDIVVVGWTRGPTFPTTASAYDHTHNGEKDVFVMVLSSDLSTLKYSTLVGGDDDDYPLSVAVDDMNRIVVCGTTKSDNFPTTAGAYDTTHNSPHVSYLEDAFVFIMPMELNTLSASTYVGGESSDYGRLVIVDHSGDIVISGNTNSPNFPVSLGCFDDDVNATSLFISKLSQDLSSLIVSTYLDGGNAYHHPVGLIEDQSGSYLGSAWTNASSFPTSTSAFDRTFSGGYDIVVYKISSELDDLIHSTYIGGADVEYAGAICTDQEGRIFIVGDSESSDYPTTPGAYDTTYNSDVNHYPDVVLSMLSNDMSSLLASTFIGGSGSSDKGVAIGLLENGRICIAGNSYNSGYPLTSDAYDNSFNGFQDVVFTVFNDDLSHLMYSTYLGGGGLDKPTGLDMNHPNGCFISGYADPGFPTTANAYDRENDFVDGFLVKMEFPDEVHPALVTGPGPGESNPPLVRTSVAEWLAYGTTGFGVNVTCGDLDGDGYDEIITGAGPGAVYGPHVRGWKSDGSVFPNTNFLAYGTHKYGVNVSSGDIDGDGIDEILTGAGPGAVFGPHVRGWNVDGGAVASINDISYFAYGTLRWGVNVAAGDIDGDGFDEIVTGAGPGSVFGPHVRGWDYDGSGPLVPISSVSYFAYGTLQWGVNVACGDLDGDGIDEIITGPGPGFVFGSHVRGWDYSGGVLSPMPTVSYFAYPDALYGAVVAAFDVDNDGIEEILTMPGPDPNQPAHAKAWNVDGGPVTAIDEIEFYPYSDEMRYGGRIAGGWFPGR